MKVEVNEGSILDQSERGESGKNKDRGVFSVCCKGRKEWLRRGKTVSESEVRVRFFSPGIIIDLGNFSLPRPVE